VAAYFDAGLRQRARASAEKVIDLASRVRDPERLGNMYINSARVLFEDGKFQEAERCFLKAQDVYRLLDSKADLGRVYLAHAISLIEQNKLADARSLLDDAMDIFRETGAKVNETRTRLHLARVARLSGKTDEARALLDVILEDADETALPERGMAEREVALCEEALGRFEQAEAALKRSIDLLTRAEDTRELALTLRGLGDLMQRADDLAMACQAYRRAALTLEAA
jgi:tetratricopeptide (TPR) repeat protein